ncbi:MAG TPA: GNAT family N-acetyltransferase [Anaerolineales bacterium]|nr:GNAT family N-acetyltransferase [Anaerolineales bacterium]
MMMAVPALRRATPDDAYILATLTDAAYEKYVPLLGRKPQPMLADYRQLAEEYSIWLLEVAGKPAGLLVLVFQPDHVLIYSVAIHPDYQKRGLGRFLLSWAETQAREARLHLMRLYTNEKMVENIALYKRFGYEETEREAYLGGALVHMAKQLD